MEIKYLKISSKFLGESLRATMSVPQIVDTHTDLVSFWMVVFNVIWVEHVTITIKLILLSEIEYITIVAQGLYRSYVHRPPIEAHLYSWFTLP